MNKKKRIIFQFRDVCDYRFQVLSLIYEIKNIFTLNPKLSITYKFLILFSVFRIHTSYVKKCIGFFFHQTSVSMNCGGYDVFLAPRWCELCPRSAPSIPSKLLQFYFDWKKHNYKLYIIVKEITLLKLSTMYLVLHQTLYDIRVPP